MLRSGVAGPGQAVGEPRRDDAALERRWYVVQTQAHREAGAAGQLARQGYEAFLPRVERTVRHARKLRMVRAPLFPGYLFLHLDPARERWRSVNGTFGVVRLVTAHERPAPTPVGVVEALLAQTDAEGVMRFDAGLRVGQAVEVLSGPFARMVGELERLEAAGRVRVLLHLLGGPAPVSIERAALRAA